MSQTVEPNLDHYTDHKKIMDSYSVHHSDANEVAVEILKSIFQNVVNRTDIHLEGVQNVTHEKKDVKHKKTDAGDISTPIGSENSIAPECSEKIPDVAMFTPPEQQYQDIPKTKHTIDVEQNLNNQLENIVNDLTDLTYQIKNNCGVDKGLADFLEGQGEFTKEILDAYLTSTDLSKDVSIKSFVEQKRANHDFTRKPYNRNEIMHEQVPENIGEEKLLNVTNLDPDSADYNITDESDDDVEHIYGPIQTVAEVHTSDVKEEKNEKVMKSESKTNMSSAGEGAEVTVNTKNDYVSQGKIEEEADKKKRNSLRRRFWNFFARGQTVSNKSKHKQ